MGVRGLLDLLYADDSVLCGKLEEDLNAMVGYFVEICRRGLKIDADNSKVILLLGEGESLQCVVCVDRTQLEQVLEFKYLGSVLDEPGTKSVDSHRSGKWEES